MRRREKDRRVLAWIRRGLYRWETGGAGRVFRVRRIHGGWDLNGVAFPNRLAAMSAAEAQLTELELLAEAGRPR